jgi:modulator of FtsH protease
VPRVALAGLLFVALSINLDRILKGPGLPGRAGEAIVLLLTVLVACTFGLVPGQSPRVLGAELLGFGLLPWLILVGIHLGAVRGH